MHRNAGAVHVQCTNSLSYLRGRLVRPVLFSGFGGIRILLLLINLRTSSGMMYEKKVPCLEVLDARNMKPFFSNDITMPLLYSRSTLIRSVSENCLMTSHSKGVSSLARRTKRRRCCHLFHRALMAMTNSVINHDAPRKTMIRAYIQYSIRNFFSSGASTIISSGVYQRIRTMVMHGSEKSIKTFGSRRILSLSNMEPKKLLRTAVSSITAPNQYGPCLTFSSLNKKLRLKPSTALFLLKTQGSVTSA